MIRKIEELLINADPSSCVVLDQGFMIRCYNTVDLCTINKLTNDIDQPSDVIRSHLERLSKMKIDPCYRIVYDSSYQALDNELVRHGFNVIDRGVVMALRIENMERELFAFANFYEQGILSDEGISDEWFTDYRELAGMDEGYGDIFENNLKNSLEEKNVLWSLAKWSIDCNGIRNFYQRVFDHQPNFCGAKIPQSRLRQKIA